MSVYRERHNLFIGASYAAKCPHCGQVICKYAFTDVEAERELVEHVKREHWKSA